MKIRTKNNCNFLLVGSKCSFCNYTELDYIEISGKKFEPVDFEMTKLNHCVLCGREFCDECFKKAGQFDAACEDGSLCPQCSKTHYMEEDNGEGVGVLRRSDSVAVEAKWL